MSETAWIYTVVSSDQQIDSLPDQERWAREVAIANGWQITREPFAGVSSGKDGARKLLRQLIDELHATPKKTRPHRILMVRLDRAGRGNGLDTIAAIAEIRKLGVTIHTRQDGDVRLDRVTDTLRPLLEIVTGGLENEARSDKWKAVHARRRAQGLHIGLVPFGCTLVDGRAVPYEPEARIVREIFERAAEGWGYSRLSSWAQKACPMRQNADGEMEPMHWTPSTIKSLLKGQTVRSVLIGEDLLERTKAARAAAFRPRAPIRWPWPLVGALRCTCGKILTGHCSGDKPRTRYYCCRHHSLQKGEKHPTHRADALESGFVTLLRRLKDEPGLMLERGVITDLDVLQKEERRARGRVADVERRQQRVWAIADHLTGPQVRGRLDQLERELTEARAEIERVRRALDEARKAHESVEAVAEVISGMAEAWPHAPIEQQQEIARAVAALPMVGGLWVSPQSKGVLIAGVDVANGLKADASSIIATSVAIAALAQHRAILSQ